jgi:hypothetical protein
MAAGSWSTLAAPDCTRWEQLCTAIETGRLGDAPYWGGAFTLSMLANCYNCSIPGSV